MTTAGVAKKKRKVILFHIVTGLGRDVLKTSVDSKNPGHGQKMKSTLNSTRCTCNMYVF